MSRCRLLIILTLVLFMLGGLAYWDELQSESDKVSAGAKNLLVRIRPESVVHLEIQTLGASSDSQATTDETGKISLEKVSGVWEIVFPVHASADQNVVQAFIKSMTEYKYHKIVGHSEADWGKFGLDKPWKKVSMSYPAEGLAQQSSHGDLSVNRTKDQNDLELMQSNIFIGAKAPVGYSIYSRVSSKHRNSKLSYVGSQYLSTVTSKGLSQFRQKRFAKIDETSLVELDYHMRLQTPIKILKSAKGFDLVLKAYGSIDPRQPISADAVEVSSLIRSLKKLTAVEYADAPISKELAATLKPENAAYEISWVDKNGRSKPLFIGRYKNKLWATQDVTKVAYRLQDSTENKIRKIPSEFRNRRIFSFDSADLVAIALDERKFVMKDQQWFRLIGTEVAEKPEDKIRSLAVDLEFAKTSRFVDLFASEFRSLMSTEPDHQIRLEFGEVDRPPMLISLWAAKDSENYLVKIPGRDILYLISRGLVDDNFVEMELGDIPVSQLNLDARDSSASATTITGEPQIGVDENVRKTPNKSALEQASSSSTVGDEKELPERGL